MSGAEVRKNCSFLKVSTHVSHIPTGWWMFWDKYLLRLFVSFVLRRTFSGDKSKTNEWQRARKNALEKRKLCFVCVNEVLCFFSPFAFLGVWFMFYVLLNACLDIILQRAFYYDFLFWFGRRSEIYFHLYLLVWSLIHFVMRAGVQSAWCIGVKEVQTRGVPSGR